jgi:hypothetical protein
MDAAIALTSGVPRLTTGITRIQLGVGLELSDTPEDAAAAERVARIARSAQPNEIRLGEAFAAVAQQEPPDRCVLRPVDGDLAPDSGTVHRLANARDEVPNNLVPAPTSFVGREGEIGEVRRLLGHARLVTITGPPGAGKTRLAGEIAERLLGRFEDGVWFVALASISDPDWSCRPLRTLSACARRPFHWSTRSPGTSGPAISCWCWTTSSKSPKPEPR